MKKVLISAAALAVLFLTGFAQDTSYSAGLQQHPDRIRSSDEGFASEEFRLGIQAFYKGSYNEAIFEFEKALSYLPDDNLILEWMGNAYYKAGLEGNALDYWQTASDNGYGGLLLLNKIEVVRERRVTGDLNDKYMKLVEAGGFPGIFNGVEIFSGPTAVLPDMDGTLWIVAYNSNQILQINLNGHVLNRITGPLEGFDRPVDLIRLADGNMLVTESAGDRLSLLDENGKFIKHIGSKGRGVGNLVGPQYAAEDAFGRIYVTDYGNRRIDVFDPDGNGLYFFGGKQIGFDGLKGPTGIAVIGESVYVADEDTGCIYEFDRSGNYIRDLVEKKTFKKPEAIKYYQNSLIVCDKNRIVNVDIDTGAVFEYMNMGKMPSRVTTAVPDVNNNILVADFIGNSVFVMAKKQELTGGLFVQIDDIDASRFPTVTVEIKVENRHRQPVVGLQEENFFFTEKKNPIEDFRFIGSAANNKFADVTIIVDRSISSMRYKAEIETAVKEIAASMDGQGTLRLISAGFVPVTEYIGKPDRIGDFSLDAVKNPVVNEASADLAIRLAANDLIRGSKKRGIVFISDGEAGLSSFAKYNLSDLSTYMNNNCIGFSFVQVSQTPMSQEYNYIIDNTNGKLYYVFRPEGLSDVYKDIVKLPQGVYQLQFVSSLPTNFGENFLPFEAEVYLLNRSGRDESGYFAPLQ